jgi:hypothetical protein
MTKRWCRLGAIGSVVLMAACEGPPPPDAPVVDEESALVSGSNAVTSFGETDSASETAMIVNDLYGLKVVAYNSDDHAHIMYSSGDRLISPGASLMGWSYSGLAIGALFQRNRVPAQQSIGFPILWADPALAQIPGTGNVYYVELAAVQSKMPPNGQPVEGLHIGDVMGGACVARSTNGGGTFAIQPWDCFSDAHQDFWDGTSITTTSTTGPIFVAFRNTMHSTIDVWRTTNSNPNTHFTQGPNPFPGMSMCSHPRLATDTQNAFVLAPDCSGTMWLSCIGTTSICTAGTWPMQVGTGFTNGNLTIGGQAFRRGPEYAIAINNANYVYGQDAEILFTQSASDGHSVIQEESCHLFGSPHSCSPRGRIDPGVHAFHPALAVSDYVPSGMAEQVVYQASWSQQVGAPTGVEIFSGLLNGPGGGTGAIAGRGETGVTEVCSTTTLGYWGDYNANVAVDQLTRGTRPLFWTAFTDSTDAAGQLICSQQTAFTASPVNTTATWINF